MPELRRHFPHFGGQVAFGSDLKNRRLKAQLATQLQTGRGTWSKCHFLTAQLAIIHLIVSHL